MYLWPHKSAYVICRFFQQNFPNMVVKYIYKILDNIINLQCDIDEDYCVSTQINCTYEIFQYM